MPQLWLRLLQRRPTEVGFTPSKNTDHCATSGGADGGLGVEEVNRLASSDGCPLRIEFAGGGPFSKIMFPLTILI